MKRNKAKTHFMVEVLDEQLKVTRNEIPYILIQVVLLNGILSGRKL